MKSFLHFLFFLFVSFEAVAQANTALSNLSTTSINANLTPSATNTRLLGSVSASWKQLYLGDALYLAGERFVSYGSGVTLGVTAIGAEVLRINTGYANTGIGYYSLNANTSGNSNVALGTRTLQLNTTGCNNMGIGYAALFNNKTGYSNVAIGVRSLNSTVSNHNLIAIGDSALYNFATSFNNIPEVAIGSKALYSDMSGSSNTAVGVQSLYKNQSGYGNVAVGDYSLYSSTGSYNTAVGNEAGARISTGTFNTSFGHAALYLTTAGGENTAIGANAGYYLTSGDNNTFLGNDADVNVSVASVSNSTAIGYEAEVSASNVVSLGNFDVTSVISSGNFVTTSDGRYKKDLTENVPGLDFIRLLRPVTYHYDVRSMDEKMGVGKPKNHSQDGDRLLATESSKVSAEGVSAKEKKLYTGLVAQEVQAAAEKLNYDFSGVYKPQNDHDMYGLSYADFVVPLIKGMQELAKTNDSLKSKNDSLESRLERIETALSLNGSRLSGTISDAKLLQNTPNPFVSGTTISYILPRTFGRARISVTDMTGRSIKSFSVTGSGRGKLVLDASSLSAGVYNYSLEVDGKTTDSRQMILSK